MPAPHRMCYDKILPTQLLAAHDVQMSRLGHGEVLRAIMPRGKKWATASTLRVRFLSGTAAQRDMVKKFAPKWCELANLQFVFSDDPQAEIRITFDADDGAWSYVGTDCQGIPLHAATMNLGWQDEAVILHEFGHAIGLAHEHQNPAGGIQWKEDVVIRELAAAPNFWDPDTTRHNVLEKYTATQINGTNFDPDSIMLYAFPGTWTVSGKGTKENKALSTTDKSFIASAAAYPGHGNPIAPGPVALSVSEISKKAARIETAGALNLFRFEAPKQGAYVVETTGLTDVIMKLFGPNSQTKLVAEDDDSGEGSNARISADLIPGTYYVQVRHYDPAATGEYAIQVSY